MSVHSPIYDPALSARLRITVDGQVQRYAIAYDIDAGTVLRQAVNAEGKCIIVGDEIKHEWVRGLVEVTLIEATTPAS
ncbi:hypothetical protein L286_09600 [Sphingobium sp. HDIP04]|nr:hypothetical protein L286_09600 [Sphingobium sp. HDIP04]